MRDANDIYDEEDEVTLGGDANYSNEHEADGSRNNDSTDNHESISEERVNVINSSTVPGPEAFQEISGNLRAVYQAYCISGHESSLNGSLLAR